jgi:RNA polymerase sigma-70 factor (ECF subfamily)
MLAGGRRAARRTASEGGRITDDISGDEVGRGTRPEDAVVQAAPRLTTVPFAGTVIRTSHRLELEAAVAAAFDAHAEALKGFASAAARDPDAADDLVQESFIRLIREIRGGRQPDNVRAWLFRVCANLVVSAARHRAVGERARDLLVDRRATASPEETAIRRDDDATLRAALDRLRVEERTALLLSASGLTATEVGATIGRTPNATRAFICRARIHLREALSLVEAGQR